MLHPLLLALALVATGDPASDPAGDPVVATVDGGSVRLSDVAREARFVSRDEQRYRAESGIAAERTLRDWVERQALRRIARSLAATEPTVRAALETARSGRDWFLARWRERCYDLPLALPDPATVARELAAASPAEQPPRLRVSHLFLRADDTEAEAAARSQLLAWRAEVTDLASFRRLASEHSESATAARGGALGWLRQGWLPATVEAELYALPAGTISPPIAYRGGLHLFYVEANDPGGTGVPDWQLEREQARRRAAALERCRAQRLAQAPPAAPAGTSAATDAQREAENARLWSLAQALGALAPDEAEHARDLAADAALAAVVEARLPTAPVVTDAEIAARYAQHPDAQRTPLLLAVDRLTARLGPGEDPLAFRDRVFAAADTLAAGDTTFAAVAATLPGVVHEQLPPLDPAALADRIGPFLLGQVVELTPGQVTRPLQDQDGHELSILTLVSREEPRRRTLAEARDRIVAALARERRAAARTALIRQLLDEHHYTRAADADQALSALLPMVANADAH